MDAESGQGGGGTSGIPSGVNAELKAQTANRPRRTEFKRATAEYIAETQPRAASNAAQNSRWFAALCRNSWTVSPEAASAIGRTKLIKFLW